MRTAYTVEQVRAAEASLMATLPADAARPPLMLRAAAGLATVCIGLLDHVYGARVVLLVGSGDNGGDALFAGALLARRGARVDAVQLGSRVHEGGLRALLGAGGRLCTESAAAIDAADLVLDGIVGIGGTGGLRPAAAELVDAVDERAAHGCWRVAVDLPSGVDADTGAVGGAAFTADVTVTFGCLKPGVLVAPGAGRAGVVELVDIGLGPYLPAPSLRSLGALDAAQALPEPGAADDKYTRGVVGVVAGSGVYAGAAVLCVGGAMRAGAGMVRYVGPEAAAAGVLARWPEVVVGEGRVQAWAVGPGLGTDTAARSKLERALADLDVPVLVDADGLTLLAAHPDRAELLASRRAITVLTPHDREYERFGRQIGADRAGAARALAAELGATVLLKGSTTVVADPDGSTSVNPTGTARLATAGSGDVLSGITGAYLAAGLGTLAPVLGAFVHGLAGRLAGSPAAPLVALDIAEAVPAAVQALRRAEP